MIATSRKLPDIKPQTPIAVLDRSRFKSVTVTFPIGRVALATGMQESFVRKIVGRKDQITADDLLVLLDQDAFRETIVPRSKVLDYLLSYTARATTVDHLTDRKYSLLHGHVLERLSELVPGSVQCVVTSTPYWGLRVYKDPYFVNWADGDHCPFGHEQTPEAFCRHSIEVLAALYDLLAEGGSIWWNVMDTFNTRTQIRGSAVEALRAMQGRDGKSWGDHECRRYSAGHSYLKDGEQCGIPGFLSERASQIGYYVKSVITWAKTSTLPEPQESRVSRNLEYILHLTKVRTPVFDKSIYRQLPTVLGGRNNSAETDKLTDVWTLPTSSGRDGHGAQFPLALPARCIALTSRTNDVVLDPFVGAGNTGVAALALGRRFIGIDVSKEYLRTAEKRISAATEIPLESSATRQDPQPFSERLL